MYMSESVEGLFVKTMARNMNCQSVLLKVSMGFTLFSE